MEWQSRSSTTMYSSVAAFFFNALFQKIGRCQKSFRFSQYEDRRSHQLGCVPQELGSLGQIAALLVPHSMRPLIADRSHCPIGDGHPQFWLWLHGAGVGFAELSRQAGSGYLQPSAPGSARPCGGMPGPRAAWPAAGHGEPSLPRRRVYLCVVYSK